MSRPPSPAASLDRWIADVAPKLNRAALDLAAARGLFDLAAADVQQALVRLFNSIPWTTIVRVDAVRRGLVTEADVRDVYRLDGAWWIRTWNHRRIEVGW